MAVKVSVIGAGAWGTAIANLLATNGHEVTLWCFEDEVAKEINNQSENKTYLPGVKLQSNILATSDFADLSGTKVIFSVIPAQFTKQTLVPFADQNIIGDDVPIVICSKGIENSSLKLMSDILREVFFHNPLAAMSGPNFADEIAAGKSAITTIACENRERAEFIADIVKNENFRPFICEDIIGAEIAGSIKNVIAIAMGLAAGMELSESSKASILTKGLNEIGILSRALGGRKRTAMEPCGVGDLVLTCSSQKSRNMSLGYELGKGGDLDKILKGRKTVAEGVPTTKAAKELAIKHNLNLEIVDLLYRVLYEKHNIQESDFF